MDAESESLSAVMQSKLIDQVRRIARTLHVAKRTEEAYVGWIFMNRIFRPGLAGSGYLTPSQSNGPKPVRISGLSNNCSDTPMCQRP